MVVSVDRTTDQVIADRIYSLVSVRLQEADRRTIPRLVPRNDKTLTLPSFPLWTKIQHHNGIAHNELG
jgi:hypothetical protein